MVANNNICILDDLTEEECSHDVYDFNWEIIDDVGTDGLPGDPTDEDEDCEPEAVSYKHLRAHETLRNIV